MSQPVLYGAIIYAKDYRALASFYEHVAGLTPRDAAFQLVILQIPERHRSEHCNREAATEALEHADQALPQRKQH
jgi:hypothetical protein